MTQLENIEAIEKRLWSAADTLRANSNYASNEYFMPVMGLFDEIVNPALNEILILLDQNQKLARARDLLLPRLMSGEIDPVRYDELSNGVEV